MDQRSSENNEREERATRQDDRCSEAISRKGSGEITSREPVRFQRSEREAFLPQSDIDGI
jgi:hypothetical protein